MKSDADVLLELGDALLEPVVMLASELNEVVEAANDRDERRADLGNLGLHGGEPNLDAFQAPIYPLVVLAKTANLVTNLLQDEDCKVAHGIAICTHPSKRSALVVLEQAERPSSPEDDAEDSYLDEQDARLERSRAGY